MQMPKLQARVSGATAHWGRTIGCCMACRCLLELPAASVHELAPRGCFRQGPLRWGVACLQHKGPLPALCTASSIAASIAPTRQIEGRGNGIKTNVVNNAEIAKALERPPDCEPLAALPCCPLLSLFLLWPRSFAAAWLPESASAAAAAAAVGSLSTMWCGCSPGLLSVVCALCLPCLPPADCLKYYGYELGALTNYDKKSGAQRAAAVRGADPRCLVQCRLRISRVHSSRQMRGGQEGRDGQPASCCASSQTARTLHLHAGNSIVNGAHDASRLSELLEGFIKK